MIWAVEPIRRVGSCKRANHKSRICQLHQDSRYPELATLAYTKLLTIQRRQRGLLIDESLVEG